MRAATSNQYQALRQESDNCTALVAADTESDQDAVGSTRGSVRARHCGCTFRGHHVCIAATTLLGGSCLYLVTQGHQLVTPLFLCISQFAGTARSTRNGPLESAPQWKRRDWQEVACPACAPKRRIVPDVVIPFFERDLCIFDITARSLSFHDPEHLLGDAYLMWVSVKPSSEYWSALSEIQKSMSLTRRVHFFDFSSSIKAASLSQTGWLAQQVLKLKIATLVRTDFYLVMDAKNTLIRDVSSQTFFTSCNQAKISGDYLYDQLPWPFSQWYASVADLLNMSVPSDIYWPMSVTPMVLHRQTVLGMLVSIGEDPSLAHLCAGTLCNLLRHHATEFTMYMLYALSGPDWNCTHMVEQTNGSNKWSTTLWVNTPPVRNLELCRDTALGNTSSIMFGVHHASPSPLDVMPFNSQARAKMYLFNIYQRAVPRGSLAASINRTTLLACLFG